VLGAMPTLAWACFSENFAAWPRKRGHGTRYTKVRCALMVFIGDTLRLHVRVLYTLLLAHIEQKLSSQSRYDGRLHETIGEGKMEKRERVDYGSTKYGRLGYGRA
jgi:acyl dehydratase